MLFALNFCFLHLIPDLHFFAVLSILNAYGNKLQKQYKISGFAVLYLKINSNSKTTSAQSHASLQMSTNIKSKIQKLNCFEPSNRKKKSFTMELVNTDIINIKIKAELQLCLQKCKQLLSDFKGLALLVATTVF